MCRFLSAIAFADGDVYTNDATDSHEHLIAALDLDDSGDIEKNKWCRVEYTTEEGKDLVDISRYELRIDQERPAWITDELEERWARKLRQQAKGMILTTGKKKILLGGKWILGGDVRIDRAFNANIRAMYSSSRVGTMHSSSRVGTMFDNSRVDTIYSSSMVGTMQDNSRVRTMYGNSLVDRMQDNSRVRTMHSSSRVGTMFDNSRVDTMHNNSLVDTMHNNSLVGTMYDNSRAIDVISRDNR